MLFRSGTTNVFRVLGTKAGVLVFLGDFAKGLVPVYIATQVVSGGDTALVSVLVAGAAITGHNWSIFLKGRGGKGVATGGGAVMALMPWIFLMVFGVFWLVLLVDRRVSVASLSSAVAFGAATLATGQPAAYIVFALAGTAVVFYAHRANIRRISAGEESRVSISRNRSSDDHPSGAASTVTPPVGNRTDDGDRKGKHDAAETFEWEERKP